jgi:signal transduction histidine kinase
LLPMNSALIAHYFFMGIMPPRTDASIQRMQELGKTNEALRRGVDLLVDLAAIDAFLSVSLRTIADVLQIPSAYFWNAKEGEWKLRLRYENGIVTRGAPSCDYEAYEPVRYNRNEWWYDADGRLQTASLIARLSDPPALFNESQRVMLLQKNTPALLNVPVILGGKALAAVTSPLRAEMHDPSPWRLGLVCSFTNQVALALHMAHLAEAAKRAAVTEERNRLARDLHDTLAQGFAAIIMQLQAASGARGRIPAEVSSYLDRAMALARENLAEARRSVRTLRPASFRAGFAGALHNLATRAQRLTDISIQVYAAPGLPILPRKVEDELLRITQEALSNATKHSRARLITIEASEMEDGILISVKDDGRGFDADSPTAGYGLMGMQERAEQIGATVTVIAEIDSGTTVVAAWSPQTRA